MNNAEKIKLMKHKEIIKDALLRAGCPVETALKYIVRDREGEKKGWHIESKIGRVYLGPDRKVVEAFINSPTFAGLVKNMWSDVEWYDGNPFYRE